MNKSIVAEISKNWKLGESPTGLLLSQRFEVVINTNFNRSYKLIDWKLTTSEFDGTMNETIIAIFEKIENE